MAKMSRIAAVAVGAILTIGLIGTNSAHAAQINAFLFPEHNEGHAKFMGLKFIQIRYQQGSSVASMFDGINEKIEFTVPLLAEQLEQINSALLESNSPLRLTNANVTYSGTIRGSHETLTLAYRTELDSQLAGYVLNPSSNSTETILVDSNWRGFVIEGPMMVDAGQGAVNVNEPIGLLQATFSEFAQTLMEANTETKTIMTEPILDFGDIGRVPLERWHILFDPTMSQASMTGVINDVNIGKAKVLSVYSLGECSIREGCPEPTEDDSTASIYGSDLKAHISTPQPNAQIEIAGYTTIEKGPVNGDLEVIGVNLNQQATNGPPPFTMQVLLILGGMMGAVAVAVLYKARK